MWTVRGRTSQPEAETLAGQEGVTPHVWESVDLTLSLDTSRSSWGVLRLDGTRPDVVGVGEPRESPVLKGCAQGPNRLRYTKVLLSVGATARLLPDTWTPT